MRQDLQNQELDGSNHPVNLVNPVKKSGEFRQDLQDQQDWRNRFGQVICPKLKGLGYAK